MHIPFNLSEIEVRLNLNVKSERVKLDRRDAILNLFKHVWDQNVIEYQEHFIALYLNSANYFLGYRWISKGGSNGTVVDPKHLFGIAVKCNSSCIIIAHNHPSGKLIPSESDKNLTRRLIRGGDLLDISILDHFIINSRFEYFSFAEEGLLQT